MSINNNVFKFLFFDQYLYNNDGGEPLTMVNEFALYLKKFNSMKDTYNLINFMNKFIDKTTYKNLMFTLHQLIQSNQLDKESLYKILSSNNNNLILLSGWAGVPGHSIALYIIYSPTTDMYQVIIINTGHGIKYHKDNNIIILYNNINIENIIKLIKINYFFNYMDIKTLNEKQHALSLYNDNKKYPLKNKEVINNLILMGLVEESFTLLTKTNYTLDVNFFYNNIYLILGNTDRQNKINISATPQLSGSCSFYSFYYLIKVLFNNTVEFDLFITNIKNDLMNKFIDQIKDDMIYCKDPTIYINTAMMILKDHMTAGSFDRRDELIHIMMKRIQSHNNNLIKDKVYSTKDTSNMSRGDTFIADIKDILSLYRKIIINPFEIERNRNNILTSNEIYILEQLPNIYNKIKKIAPFDIMELNKIIQGSNNEFLNSNEKLQLATLLHYNNYNMLNLDITLDYIFLYMTNIDIIYAYEKNTDLCNYILNFRIGICTKMLCSLFDSYKDTIELMNSSEIKNIIRCVTSIFNFFRDKIVIGILKKYDNIFISYLYNIYYTLMKIIKIDMIPLTNEVIIEGERVTNFLDKFLYDDMEIFSLKINYKEFIHLFKKYRGLFFIEGKDNKYNCIFDRYLIFDAIKPIYSNVKHEAITLNYNTMYDEDFNLCSFYKELMNFDNIINSINNMININQNIQILDSFYKNNSYYNDITVVNYNLFLNNENILIDCDKTMIALLPVCKINCIYDMLYIILNKLDIKNFILLIDQMNETNIMNLIVLLKIIVPEKINDNIELIEKVKKYSTIYNIIKCTYYNDMFSHSTIRQSSYLYQEIFLNQKINGTVLDKMEEIIINKVNQLKDKIITIYDETYGEMTQTSIDINYNIPNDIFVDKNNNLYYRFKNITIASYSFIPLTQANDNFYIKTYILSKYNIIKHKYSDNFIKIINRLSEIDVKFILLEKKTNYTILLPEFDGMFIQKGDCNDIIFEYNNKKYNVEFTSQYNMINMWLLFMKNGFILYDKMHGYKLLIFSSNNFIVSNLKSSYWIGINNSYNNLPILDNDMVIIDFHLTNLCFNFVNTKDFIILYISLCVAKNYIGTMLLRSRLYNLNHTKYLEKDKTYKYMEFLITICKDIMVDIPNWSVLLDNTITNYTITSNSNTRLVNDRKKFFDSTFIPTSSYKFNAMNIGEFNIIKDICDKINAMDKQKLSPKIPSIIYKILSRYKCEDMNTIQPKIFSYTRNEELAKLRLADVKDIFLYDNINNNKKMMDNTYNDMMNTPLESFDNSLEDDIILKFILGTIPSVYSLYYTFNEYFYTKIIKSKFNNIVAFFKNYKKEIGYNTSYNCGFILKQLESLDPYIIDTSIEKTYDTIIFEIHTTQFIRKDQNKIIMLILDEINKLRDKTYKPTSSFEILMGRGKTSIITPYLILYNVNKNHSLDYNINMNIHIILPSNLVQSSFNIMDRFIDIFDKISITMNDFNIYKENGQAVNVRIHSESEMKNSILQLRIDNKMTILKELFEKNSFCIFDEIDNMINPLKSNLNIPILPYIIHPYNDIIVSLIISLATLIHKNTSMNMSRGQINISSSINTIRINKNDIITNLDNDTNTVLVNKLIYIKNKINDMVYSRHYGFRNMGIIDFNKLTNNYTSYKNYYIAIPYNGNHNPVNGSEFSDYELSLLLTILSYFNKKMRREDIILLLFYIDTFHYKQNKSNIIYVEIFFSRLMEIIGEKLLVEALDSINNNMSDTIVKLLLNRINSLPFILLQEVIIIYLENIIFKLFFTIPKKQYNISTVDLLGREISLNKICFSGTVNYNTLEEVQKDVSSDMRLKSYSSQLYSVVNDTYGVLFIKTAIEGTLYKPTLYYYDEYNKEETLLNFIKVNLSSFQALIDTGGLIIDKTPLEVIKILYEVDKTRTYLYIDTNGQKLIYGDKIQGNYDNKMYSNLFIYYDNKNCIGIDFIQPYTMKGLITINYSNNLTEISQGIFRLRNINIGHTIDFYITDKMRGLDIYKHLLENDKKNKDNCKQLIILQYIKYFDRMNNNNNINNYIEPVYYDTMKQDIMSQDIYYDSDMSEDSDMSQDSNMDSLPIASYNVFVNNLIDSINYNNKNKLFKNITVPKHIMLDLTSTNIAISTNIITVKNTTSTNNDISIFSINSINDDFDDMNKYFNFMKDTNLFTYNNLSSKDLFKIDNISIIISPYYLYYYKDKLDLYYVIKKDNISYIHVITLFELMLLKMSNTNLLEQVNIYDKYGTIIHNKFDFIIPSHIIFLLFKSTLNITETIRCINILYNITKNTKDIIDFCKNILHNDINLNPCDNIKFKTNDMNIEFWGNLLNLNVNKMNKTVYNNFKKIIKEALGDTKLDILQTVKQPVKQPVKQKKPSLKLGKKDDIMRKSNYGMDNDSYNKYLKYKNKYNMLKAANAKQLI